MGIHVQQLCILKMSKNGKSVEYFGIKDQVQKKKYLVTYSGYDESKACWLPESELHNTLKVLNDYIVSHELN